MNISGLREGCSVTDVSVSSQVLFQVTHTTRLSSISCIKVSGVVCRKNLENVEMSGSQRAECPNSSKDLDMEQSHRAHLYQSAHVNLSMWSQNQMNSRRDYSDILPDKDEPVNLEDLTDISTLNRKRKIVRSDFSDGTDVTSKVNRIGSMGRMRKPKIDRVQNHMQEVKRWGDHFRSSQISTPLNDAQSQGINRNNKPENASYDEYHQSNNSSNPAPMNEYHNNKDTTSLPITPYIANANNYSIGFSKTVSPLGTERTYSVVQFMMEKARKPTDKFSHSNSVEFSECSTGYSGEIRDGTDIKEESSYYSDQFDSYEGNYSDLPNSVLRQQNRASNSAREYQDKNQYLRSFDLDGVMDRGGELYSDNLVSRKGVPEDEWNSLNKFRFGLTSEDFGNSRQNDISDYFHGFNSNGKGNLGAEKFNDMFGRKEYVNLSNSTVDYSCEKFNCNLAEDKSLLMEEITARPVSLYDDSVMKNFNSKSSQFIHPIKSSSKKRPTRRLFDEIPNQSKPVKQSTKLFGSDDLVNKPLFDFGQSFNKLDSEETTNQGSLFSQSKSSTNLKLFENPKQAVQPVYEADKYSSYDQSEHCLNTTPSVDDYMKFSEGIQLSSTPLRSVRNIDRPCAEISQKQNVSNHASEEMDCYAINKSVTAKDLNTSTFVESLSEKTSSKSLNEFGGNCSIYSDSCFKIPSTSSYSLSNRCCVSETLRNKILANCENKGSDLKADSAKCLFDSRMVSPRNQVLNVSCGKIEGASKIKGAGKIEGAGKIDLTGRIADKVSSKILGGSGGKRGDVGSLLHKRLFTQPVVLATATRDDINKHSGLKQSKICQARNNYGSVRPELHSDVSMRAQAGRSVTGGSDSYKNSSGSVKQTTQDFITLYSSTFLQDHTKAQSEQRSMDSPTLSSAAGFTDRDIPSCLADRSTTDTVIKPNYNNDTTAHNKSALLFEDDDDVCDDSNDDELYHHDDIMNDDDACDNIIDDNDELYQQDDIVRECNITSNDLLDSGQGYKHDSNVSYRSSKTEQGFESNALGLNKVSYACDDKLMQFRPVYREK